MSASSGLVMAYLDNEGADADARLEHILCHQLRNTTVNRFSLTGDSPLPAAVSNAFPKVSAECRDYQHYKGI